MTNRFHNTYRVRVLALALSLAALSPAQVACGSDFGPAFTDNGMRDVIAQFIFKLNDLAEGMKKKQTVHAPYHLAHFAVLAESNGILDKKFPKEYFTTFNMKTPKDMTVLQWIQLQWNTLHNVFTQSEIKITMEVFGEHVHVDSPGFLRHYFDSEGLNNPDALWIYLQFLEQTDSIKVHDGGFFSIFKDGIKRKKLNKTFKTPSKLKTRELCKRFTPAAVAKSVTKLTKDIEEKYRRENTNLEKTGTQETPTRHTTPMKHLIPDDHPLSPLNPNLKSSIHCSPQPLDAQNDSTIFDILELLSPIEKSGSQKHWADEDDTSYENEEDSPIKPRNINFSQQEESCSSEESHDEKRDENTKEIEFSVNISINGVLVDVTDNNSTITSNDETPQTPAVDQSTSSTARTTTPSQIPESQEQPKENSTKVAEPLEEVAQSTTEPAAELENKNTNNTARTIRPTQQPEPQEQPKENSPEVVGPLNEVTQSTTEPTAELENKQTEDKQQKQVDDNGPSALAIGAVAVALVTSLGLVAHATHLTDRVFYAITGRLTQRVKQKLADDISTATTKCTTEKQLYDTHIALHRRFLDYHIDDVQQIYTMAEALTTAAAAA